MKEKILGILDKYEIDEYHWKLEIASEILALKLEMPSDEEIEHEADNYSTYDQTEDCEFPQVQKCDGDYLSFIDAANWLKSEIIRRNK
jgi:hypothetical protein